MQITALFASLTVWTTQVMYCCETRLSMPSTTCVRIVRTHSLQQYHHTDTVEALRESETHTASIMTDLESYLGIEYYPEDDLYIFNSSKCPGTCEWLTKSIPFQQWAESDQKVTTFWLRGMFGTGKSILSAHVTDHLKSSGKEVAVHFFKQGRGGQWTVASMLRHLAFQLARQHHSIRLRLHHLSKSEVALDKDEDRAIWRRLFVNEICKTLIASTQFWIFDGVDECNNAATLIGLIGRVEAPFPIRIFISSRNLPSIKKSFNSIQHQVFQHMIQVDDTMPDIRAYIHGACESATLSLEGPGALAERVLDKAQGSFLWVKLALEELEHTYSDESMTEVLNEIPAGMAALYERLLDTMALNIREIKLTQAILAWSVCTTRSLTIAELALALKHDLGINIPNMERSVQGLCGQLVRVENAGRVQIIHATARNFLLEQTKQQAFIMDGPQTHGRIVAVCLNLLCSEEFRPPRVASVQRPGSRSCLADYAAVSWTEHLASTPPTDNTLFRLLVRFFRSNVLTWMEFVASRKKDLWHLTRAAKNLRCYLDRRAKHMSPLGVEHSMINGWTIDLLRVVAKFGHHLLEDPQSIHLFIAPLCPSQSQIGQQFGAVPGRISLAGPTNLTWDDCIRYIDYRGIRATALAGGDNIFAIGFRNGGVSLYHKSTCQERGRLMHGELVKVIEFDHSSSRLATSGNKQLKLWTINGQLLWSRSYQDPPVTLSFAPTDDALVAVTRSSSIECWSGRDGSVVTLGVMEGHVPHGPQNKNTRQAVLSCDISPDLRLVAFGYRGRAVELWSLEDDATLGLCEKDALSVSEVLFNPNSSMEMLAVTYQDGELTIFDTWSRQELVTVTGEAYIMACTPDGRTLATGDMLGTIKIWDFETLHLLYCIKSPDYEVKSLAFSGDGLRLYDIRDHKSKVWEPAALVRKNLNEESTIGEPVSIADPAPSVGSYGETVVVTALLTLADPDIIIVGKDDGAVCIYDSKTGQNRGVLYKHSKDVLVTHLGWDASHSRVVSIDAASKVLVWDVVQDHLNKGAWKATSLAYNLHADSTVRQVAFMSGGRQLLVATTSSTTLHELRDDSALLGADAPVNLNACNPNMHYLWQRPIEPIIPHGLLLEVEAGELRVVDILAASQLPARVISLKSIAQTSEDAGQPTQRTQIDPTGEWLVIQQQQGPSISSLLIYWLKQLDMGQAPTPHNSSLFPVAFLAPTKFKQYLGFHGSKLIFLDAHLWTCSLDLSRCGGGSRGDLDKGIIEARTKLATKRHFPIPYELIGSSNGIHGTVTRHGGVCFPRAGELSIINGGLLNSF